LSVMRTVSHADEWVAEAYMETDYSQLQESAFERKVKEYIAFRLLNDISDAEA